MEPFRYHSEFSSPDMFYKRRNDKTPCKMRWLASRILGPHPTIIYDCFFSNASGPSTIPFIGLLISTKLFVLGHPPHLQSWRFFLVFEISTRLDLWVPSQYLTLNNTFFTSIEFSLSLVDHVLSSLWNCPLSVLFLVSSLDLKILFYYFYPSTFFHFFKPNNDRSQIVPHNLNWITT